MLCSFLAAPILAALLVAPPRPPDRAPHGTTAADSAAVAAIAAEIRAFYRDLDARNWSPLLDHFIPAKVTARWAPPAASHAWASLQPPPATSGGTAPCDPRTSMAVIDDWARVLIRRCAAAVDEAWLLRVSGRWKIVHLDLAPRPLSAGPCLVPASCAFRHRGTEAQSRVYGTPRRALCPVPSALCLPRLPSATEAPRTTTE